MKPINISIPKPCHENWDAMTPEDKGQFCGLCQKTVVDFTTMDNTGVANFFEQHKGQKVCGRFRNEQLTQPEKPLLPPALVNRIARRPLSSIQMFALALLVCMGTTLFSCKKDNNTVGEMAPIENIDTVQNAERNAVEEKKPKAVKEENVEEVTLYSKGVQMTTGMIALEPPVDISTLPFVGGNTVDSLKNSKRQTEEPPHLMGDTIVAPKP